MTSARAVTARIYSFRVEHLAGLRVDQMRLSALVILRIISRPSLDIVACGAAVKEGRL